jgi:hypothetical protein
VRTFENSEWIANTLDKRMRRSAFGGQPSA